MGKIAWSALVREPILHFVVLAALLFGMHAVFADSVRPVINVDPVTIDILMRERAELTNRPQTDIDRREVIETYIADEILLREAQRRGLDRTPRIRAMLIQTMRFALLGDGPHPSEAALRAYFDANGARFVRPPTISLTQVLVPDGKQLSDNPLMSLQMGIDPTTGVRLDDRAGSHIRHASLDDLTGLFGAEVARAIERLPDGIWHGPFRSARGTSFIRIDERRSASMPTYEQAASYIAGEWIMAEQRARLVQEIAVLRRDYTIVVPQVRNGR